MKLPLWAAASAGAMAGIGLALYAEPATAGGAAFLVVVCTMGAMALWWFGQAFVPLETEICVWHGISGKTYTYGVHDRYLRFSEYQIIPCNFAFVRVENGIATPLYFGETEDAVKHPFAWHVEWEDAVRLGVTHIHVGFGCDDKDEEARCAQANDLIMNYAPSLNGRVRAGWPAA